MNIVFGTKRLGGTQSNTSSEKHPGRAVVTVEGQKGPKKSRRILFNTAAAELLSLEEKNVQNLVFGFVEPGADVDSEVLIANVATIQGATDEMVTYKTSKNKVSYGEDTSERGKAVTSSHMCTEIFSFLGGDDSDNLEFALVSFDPATSIESYALRSLTEETQGADDLSTPDVAAATEVVDEEVIETNAGTMTGEELYDSVKDEVLRAEEENPVLQSETNEYAEKEQPLAVESDWM